MNANRLNGDDRLSSLPDDVLCHILSFLPTKLAAATSVLSTRWKHLPDLVPDIDLRDYNVGGTKPAQVYSLEEKDHASARFMEFVLKVLMVRTFPTVREIPKFRLSCRMVHDHDILCQSILLLLMRNIRELNLSVNLLDSDTLPDEIYQCKALEYLEIGSELHLNVSKSVVLPNLKVIKLHSVYFYGDSSIRKLLSGCPVLEDLSLSICLFREDTVEICHPLLKNLTLVHSVVEDHIIFDTPNLCNLFYVSDTDLTFEVKNMESLVHAHISWGSTETQLKQYKYQDLENLSVNSSNGTKFINAMLKARFLYLEGSSINALYFSDCGMTTFQNLILMEVGSTNVSEWLVLPDLLESTPNLKVLVFYEGFINCNSRVNKADYRLPDIAPTCFSRSLEEIKIGVFDGHKCELELVEYFLKSVKCLKMMMIGAKVSSVSPFGYPRFFRPLNFLRKRPEWVLPTSQRLSVAPRCSEDCQIMLTWLSGRKKYGQKIL